MIHQTINILAAPNRRATIHIAEGDLAKYTTQRQQLDAEHLAKLLVKVLPVTTFLAFAGHVAMLKVAIEGAIEREGRE